MQDVATIDDAETKANIAANVKRLRGAKSYSQVARDCCTPTWKAYPATIEQIEKGQHMPGSGLLVRLAEALGCTTNDLVSPPPGTPSPSKKRRLSPA